jgi:hypothetical protein
MEKALDPFCPREDAIVAVPEDKVVRTDFGRVVELDLSTPTKEYESLHFPLNMLFNSLDWFLGFNDFWSSRADGKERVDLFRSFNDAIIKNFTEFCKRWSNSATPAGRKQQHVVIGSSLPENGA